MKSITILFSILFFVKIASAQTVPLDSAKYYEGKTVTICSKVLGTYVSNGEKKITKLNFGKPFPDQTFVVVMFEDVAAKFSYVPADFLKDKNICITGTIKMFKGLPEIMITDPSQIKVN